MNSNQIAHYLRFGLPARLQRSYQFVNNKLISRRTQKEYAPVDEIDDIIAALLRDEPLTLRGTYDNLKRTYTNIGLPRVKKYFAKDEDYQSRRPTKKRQTAVTVRASEPLKIAQIDLTEVPKMWNRNNLYKYILVYIDIYSKKADAELIRNKDTVTVVRSLGRILQRNRLPSAIQSDNGSEFVSQHMDNFLQQHNIKHILSDAYMPTSQGVVERFNKTLKRMITIWMYRPDDPNAPAPRNNQFTNVTLQKVLDNYNSTTHEAIGESPDAVHQGQAPRRRQPINVAPQAQFQVGDAVRLARSLFDKDYRKERLFMKTSITQNWTEEIYFVSKVHQHQHNRVESYTVRDNVGDVISTQVSPYQLQRADV